MSDWLDPVRAALDAVETGVRCFVRDDDGGWDDPGLLRLLGRARHHGVVVDVAVIPAAVGPGLDPFAELVRAGEARAHQHGFTHQDHAVSGRRCEFGDDRPTSEIEDDLRRGWSILHDRLECRIDPIFTPPWNRCSSATAECLRSIGYRVLSRESGATPFGLDGLVEVPVTFDWFAKRKGVALSFEERGRVLADQLAGGRVGIMLHHSVTTATDLFEIDRLLGLLRASGVVEFTTITDEAARQTVGT